MHVAKFEFKFIFVYFCFLLICLNLCCYVLATGFRRIKDFQWIFIQPTPFQYIKHQLACLKKMHQTAKRICLLILDAKLHISLRRSPKSPNDSTFVQPAAAYSLCQEYSSTRTAVVHSPWLVRPSGKHSATICMIQNSASPARSPIEDALISAVFGALIALEALCYNALYKLTLALTLQASYTTCVLRRFAISHQ